MKTKLIILAAALFALTGAPATAREDEAHAAAGAAIEFLEDHGYEIIHVGDGFLEDGEVDGVTETFHAGREYFIVAVGCENAADIDLGLLRKDGVILDEDTRAKGGASLRFTLRQTATLSAVVGMVESLDGTGAHWALVIGVR